MNIIQNTTQKNIFIFMMIFVFPLFAFVIASENSYYGIVIAGLILIFLFLMKFEIIFPLLLISRSSLDIFTDVGFYIGPLNFNVPSTLSIFIDVMGLFYLGLVFSREKKSFLDNVSKIFLIWLLGLLFWVFWAHHNLGGQGLLGLREWIRIFSLFMIYLLSVQLVKLKGYEYFINCTLLSLIVPVSIGYHQIFFQPDLLISGGHRIYGTLAHPNNFSLYLVLLIAVASWKWKFSKVKAPWLGLMFVLTFALVNTYSVGGLVMFVLFISVFVYMEFQFKYRIILLLFSFLFLFLFINTEMGQKRIDDLKRTPPLTEVVKDEVVTNSFTWRIVNWKVLFKKWTDKPVLGYGLNTANLINPWYMSAAHNDYLRFLVELGLIGFSFYLWFVIRIGFYIKEQYRSCLDEKQKYLVMLIGIVFITWMVGSSVDNYISATAFQFYFWSILAAVMAKPTGGIKTKHITQIF